MIVTKESLPFVQEYIQALNKGLKNHDDGKGLSKIQCSWLSFVLTGLLVTNSLCWARFERFGLGEYKAAAMCWMFRRASIVWETLLQASTCYIIERYGIKSGILVVDDSDIQRSKNTTEIAKVHKMKDKTTGGFISGQNIVFLVLVSNQLTIPVGFKFSAPDPARTAFIKEDKRLRSKGVAKKYRPDPPEENPAYPGKKKLALQMIEEFTKNHPNVKIKAVTADSLYGKKDFMDKSAELIGNKQIISQIASNQHINVNGTYIQVGKFFGNYSGKTEEVELRHSKKKIRFCSAKFKVKSHDSKYWVIALKYEGEEEYRYLIANDMSWRDIDVIEAYASRWLVEVFIQDWKSYEGWHQLAKQRGVEGSDRGLILSLLCDHMLYFHDDHLTLFENKEHAVTVGSLREKIIMESLVSFIEKIVRADDAEDMLANLINNINDNFTLNKSLKHMRKFAHPKETKMTAA